MCERVSGAASGALYANESGAYFALRKRISTPAHHTWRSYAMFLRDVMPERTAEHYRNKIAAVSYTHLAQRDDWLKREIQRVYDENHQVYGVRKVGRQLLREGIRAVSYTHLVNRF